MSIFSKTYNLVKSNFFNDFIEMHCHLLPGVDDGVQTINESLKILQNYENLGIKKVWLTPHVMEDIPNTTEGLKNRFEELKNTYKGNIKLFLSAEYMLDNLFVNRIDNNDLLAMGKKRNYLLVETSYFNPPIYLYEKLEDIKNKGYFPILAHTERYLYMNKKQYHKLKEMGILFQLNLMSMIGYYGKDAKEKAEYLLKNSFYDVSGTDIHYIKALEKIKKISLTKKQLTEIFRLKKHTHMLKI